MKETLEKKEKEVRDIEAEADIEKKQMLDVGVNVFVNTLMAIGDKKNDTRNVYAQIPIYYCVDG